jgi:hypothetical protein
MRDERKETMLEGEDLATCIERDTSLTDGQRRRLRVFQGVEDGVCSRVESICAESDIQVTDVGVLVISSEARAIFFGPGGEAGTHVILGHRSQIHTFLHTVLPPADGAPFDPYIDLLEPAPACCVRVLIVDDESLTVLSYGSFVTVCLGRREMPQA